LNARGQITDETYGNNVKSDRTYDANGYLTLIKTGTNGNIQNLEYIYNSKGQMYPLNPPPTSPLREVGLRLEYY
jgi:hypothetical protein